ncbi:hypothetical protein N657DRAFT_653905 [Parathielavia appendiculata]|uniref:DUF1996 domain-containing protein n=1 Tax=Parathielavia appendiculata TaxID=2587402 RepID=A0AAN6Z836_9PEZI|nr:hypothetical protein N657DRAFT_653905 [Parathielavia appendiculata]
MRIDASLAILASLSGVAAFWRLECRGRLAIARLDPLISPGTASLHAHAIHGSSGFNAAATYEDLRNGDCTSCAVTQDMSAYWAPTLYFKHANGSYEEVQQIGGMLAYYMLNKDLKDINKQITAFPNNFRMIAGDSTRRNYSVTGGYSVFEADPPKSRWAEFQQVNQHDLAQRATGFNCLNYNVAAEGALMRHYLPDKAYLDAHCSEGVRFEIAFPSCWNGVDVSTPNHKSHVAYPDLVLNGNCPEGFDVKLPTLMYETIWATHAFNSVPGEFVISNGDTQGFGYHADFMSGWDSEFLQAAVNQCTNLTGRIQDCPLFDVISEDQQRQCKMAAPAILTSEKVTGIIGDSLPGGVVIQYGPEPATGGSNAHTVPVSVAVPTVSYTPGTTASEGNYLPGGVFKESPTSTSVSSSTSSSVSSLSSSAEAEVNALAEPSPSPTPTPIPSDPPVPEGYDLVRTDYVTNGNVVSKIVVIETVEYVVMTTEVVTVTATPEVNKVRRDVHLHHHRHHHGLH